MKTLLPATLLLFAAIAPAAAAEAIGAGHEYDNIRLDAAPHSDASELPAALRVDPARTVRSYDAAMFGLSYDFTFHDRLGMAEAVPGEPLPRLLPDFPRVAKDVPLPFNRLWIVRDNWKWSIGPVAERRKHKRVPWEAPTLQIAGPVETVRNILAVDPAAKFNMMVTVKDDEAVAQARQIAEFFTGDASTEWGRKRIEYGLAEPVDVALWELGNETDWSNPRLPVAEYVRLCKATIAAIRGVDPRAKFAPHAATAPWHETQKAHWKEWHRTLLKELAPDISCFAFHPYYHGYPISLIEGYMKQISDDIAASANPKITIFVSEHGLWPGGEPGEWKNSWYKTHALVGCLAVSEWFNRMLAHPEVSAMTMHAASSGPWGMFYPDPYGGNVYSTALTDLFKFYKLIPWGGKVVATGLTGEGTAFDGKLSLSAVAVEGDDGKLRVILTNRLPKTARKISLDLGKRRVKHVYTLAADSVKEVNTAADRPVGISYRPGTEQDSRTFRAPSRSITLLVAE